MYPNIVLGQALNPFSPLRRGLVAWYAPFPAISSGITWYDVVGRLHGTNIGGPTWIGDPTGRLGNLLRYNGTTQYTNVGNVAALSFDRTNAFSVALWFQASAGSAGFFSKQSDTGNPGYWFGLYSGGNIVFYFGDTGTANIQVETSASFADNQLHHGVFTYDGSSTGAGVVIYVDGAVQSVTVTGGPLTVSALTSLPVIIGANADPAGLLSGALGSILVYNRVLSNAEIQSIYTMKSPNYAGLVLEDIIALTVPIRKIPRKVIME